MLAIPYLTLYGAHASTVFWVIGHYLHDTYGWRDIGIVLFALIMSINGFVFGVISLQLVPLLEVAERTISR